MALRPWWLLFVALAACDGDAPASEVAPTASAASNAQLANERADALLRAELQRDFEVIRPDDLRSRQVSVRRAAARALARLRDDRGRSLLLTALGDEDETVAAWAAYGLGDLCAGARDATVSALVTAAVVRSADRGDGGQGGADGGADGGAAGGDAESADPPRDPGELGVEAAIVRAIGRCGNERAEAVLAGWARDRGSLARDAVAALGDIARARKRLREETQALLLTLAEGDALHPPRPEALYPLGRVDHLTPSVVERAREVAKARLDAGALAVKVLARTGEEAAPLLAEILVSPERDPAMRVEAARALGTMARTGQKLLAEALGKVTVVTSVDPAFHVVRAILAAIVDTRSVKVRLKELATLSVETKNDAEKRRLSAIRCAAAALLVERAYTAPELRACDLFVSDEARAVDPLSSFIGGRAVLGAIGVDGVKLEGPRLAAWRAYATTAAPALRALALRQLASHDEVKDAPAVLAQALTAEPGVVAAAAEVITSHPARATTGGALDAAVKKSLLEQLASQTDLEARAAVIGAVAALGLGEAKKELVTLCGGARRSLREHAERALAKLMPEGAPRCRGGSSLEVPVELERRAGEVRLTLKTDAGDLRLVLQPSLAPVAVTRARDLAAGDYFDGLVVHRVVPGFVAQFGSPTGDGFGGVKGLPALPCETSPVGFGDRSVGVALAGRDTGSSQLFVTFAPTPHLDGEYAWLGTAEGPWEALAEGDVIHDVIVEE